MTSGASIGGGCAAPFGSDICGEARYFRIMSAARKPMTVEEFLAWEERQEGRYEFDGFRPVATTSGTIGCSVGCIRSCDRHVTLTTSSQ
jgi:hypothetical protein